MKGWPAGDAPSEVGGLQRDAAELLQALRADARRQAEQLADNHAERLERWVQATLGTSLLPMPPNEPPLMGHGSEAYGIVVVKPSQALIPGSVDDVLEGLEPNSPTTKSITSGTPFSPPRSPRSPRRRLAAQADQGPRPKISELPWRSGNVAKERKLAVETSSRLAPRESAAPRQSTLSKASSLTPPAPRRLSVSKTFDCKTMKVRDSATRAMEKPNARLTTQIQTLSGRRNRNQLTPAELEAFGDIVKMTDVEEPDARNFFQTIVRNDAFDPMMGTMLLLSAIVVGIKVDWMARQQTLSAPLVFILLDWLFCLCFVAELAVRFLAGPRVFFQGPDRRWNIFDLIVVSFQLADEIMQVSLQGASSDALDKVSFMRVIRLARLVRFVRMVRLLSGLKSVVYLLMASMTSFLWASMILLFLMLMMAVYFTELCTLTVKSLDDSESREAMTNYWGSVLQSTLTLFMAIFGGMDWKDSLDAFRLGDHTMYYLNSVVLCLYIAFTTLVMLNLVTGVFVEGAQRIVREDRDKVLLRLAAHIFNKADTNGDDKLEEEEFQEIVDSPLMASFCDANSISTNDIEMLFQLLKEPSETYVPVAEFIRACKLLQGDARAADLQTVKLLCKNFFEQVDWQLARIEDQMTRWTTSIIVQATAS